MYSGTYMYMLLRVSSLGLKVLGGRFVTRASKCLATPTIVYHTLYYIIIVHHGRSSYILHINILQTLGGGFTPALRI